MLFTRLRLLIVMLLIIPALSCQAGQGDQNKELSPKAFAEAIIGTPDVVVLDVRTPEEFERGTHLKGAYLANWEAPDFPIRVRSLDKNKTILVYCKSGKRSHAAAAKMREMGFMKVYELKGGIEAWETEGREVTRSSSTR